MILFLHTNVTVVKDSDRINGFTDVIQSHKSFPTHIYIYIIHTHEAESFVCDLAIYHIIILLCEKL